MMDSNDRPQEEADSTYKGPYVSIETVGAS